MIRTVKAFTVLVPEPLSLYINVSALNKLPIIKSRKVITMILMSIIYFLQLNGQLCDS